MHQASAQNSFRNDINGLRAWAVLAVVLYHFQVPGLSAGFIGVDIFFVISGFLMTGIILNALENGNFSLWSFYIARARRIIPALMVLLTVLLGLGWVFLPTPDYKSLGAEVGYSLAFLSNIQYWRTAGYFDSGAHEKWLLHTWSLAIEMQFYLLYPVFASFVWKIKPGIKTFAICLMTVFVLSLILSLVVSSWRPSAAFYLLPTRGWELAAGGLVYLMGRQPKLWQPHSNMLYGAGLLMWLIGLVLIDSAMPWPSGWALLPVIGTGSIILAQKNHARLMYNPVAQSLGNISYSLYLWHWPVVVALYLAGLNKDWIWVFMGFLLSILFGYLSYKVIENPVRRSLNATGIGKQVGVFVLTGTLIGAAAVTVWLFSFDGRLPKLLESIAAESLNSDPRRAECFGTASENGSPGCIYGGENVGVILMGDSHAASVITALGEAAENNHKGALFYGLNSCPTFDGIIKPRADRPFACQLFNKWAFEQVEHYDSVPLVLVSRTSTYLLGPNEPDRVDEIDNLSVHFGVEYQSRSDSEFIREFQSALTDTACRFAQERPVYLMRPVPEFGTSVFRDLLRYYYAGKNIEDIRMPLFEYHSRNKLVWEAQDKAAENCGVEILDPLPYLCDKQYCYGSRNSRPLYYDDDHLSEYGNKYLIAMFEQIFNLR